MQQARVSIKTRICVFWAPVILVFHSRLFSLTLWLFCGKLESGDNIGVFQPRKPFASDLKDWLAMNHQIAAPNKEPGGHGAI